MAALPRRGHGMGMTCLARHAPPVADSGAGPATAHALADRSESKRCLRGRGTQHEPPDAVEDLSPCAFSWPVRCTRLNCLSR
jgi:hypothetical protein